MVVDKDLRELEMDEIIIFERQDLGLNDAYKIYKKISKKMEIIPEISVNNLKSRYEALLCKLQKFFEIQKQNTLDLLPKIKPLETKNTPNYIVTLTSYGSRLQDVPYTLITLLNQSIQPDKIILWVAHEDKGNLSPLMPKLIEKGVEVRFCEDMRSHKKLIFALEDFPNDYLITADDDVYYPEIWFEQILLEHKKYPRNIICHFARSIKKEKNNSSISNNPHALLSDYTEWEIVYSQPIDEKTPIKERYKIFPIGIGGVLYPPRSLHSDTTNKDLIKDLSPQSDDVWFWAMAIRNSKYFEGKNPYRIIENGFNSKHFKYIDPAQQIGFNANMTYNNLKGGKNLALKNVIEHYPEVQRYVEWLFRDEQIFFSHKNDENISKNTKPLNNMKPATMQEKINELQKQGYNCNNIISPKQAQRLNLNEIYFCYGGMGDGLMQKHMAEIYFQKTGEKLLLAVNHPEFFVNTSEMYILSGLYGREIKTVAADAIKNNTDIVYLNDIPFRLKLVTGIVYKEDNIRGAYKEWPIGHFVAQATSYLGLEGEININPILRLTEKEKTFGIYNKETKQIAIMNQGTQIYKSLPIETTQKIIELLQHKYTFVQIGSQDDPPLKNVVNQQGKLSLRETASVLYNSNLFVGSIGGLMHLARCVGCRSVIAYSNEPLSFEYYEGNEYVFSDTPCSECAENRMRVPFDDCPFDHKCIKGIKAEKIVSAIEKAVQSSKNLSPQNVMIQSKKINGLELLKISNKVAGYKKGLIKKDKPIEAIAINKENTHTYTEDIKPLENTKTYTSYSADFEDFILDTMFSHVKEGFYIDVGANSPWLLSATKNLYDRGWSGINIEPLLECYTDLQVERIRDINLNCGCGILESTMELIIDTPKNNWTGGLSSCSQETINNPNWKLYNKKNDLEKRLIKIKRLADICLDYREKINNNIHLLKIDVEGAEKDVLLGFDFLVRPWIISIESTEPCSNIPTFHKWEDILSNNGYSFILQYSVNRFYIDTQNSIAIKRISNNLLQINSIAKNCDFYLINKEKNRVKREKPIFDISNLSFSAISPNNTDKYHDFSNIEFFENHLMSNIEQLLMGNVEGSRWQKSQMTPKERAFLNGIIRKTKPKIVVELGTSAGGSAIVILNAIRDIDGAKLYSFDYNVLWHKNYNNLKTGFLVENIVPELMSKWELYTGGVPCKYFENIPSEGIDVCFIDTAHFNPGEHFNILEILPLMKKNGIIIYHDVMYHIKANSYTCKVSINTLKGQRIRLKSENTWGLADIEGVVLDTHLEDILYPLFTNLSLPWSYKISDDDYQNMLSYFTKYYDTELVEIYVYFCNYYMNGGTENHEKANEIATKKVLQYKESSSYTLKSEGINIDIHNIKQSVTQWYEDISKSKLDLKNPQTFCEKVQWLKVYDNHPLKTKLADKYLVRQWITDKIGDEYLIPLLGVWENTDDIDFDNLPNKFVLKCNHAQGYNIIVKNKEDINKEEIKNQLSNWMSVNMAYRYGYEMQYKDINPLIIAEELIENNSGDLTDYKFICVKGNPIYCLIINNRFANQSRTFVDMDFEYQNFNIGKPGKSFPKDFTLKKPINWDKMIELSKILSNDFKFVRVDFYNLNGKIYFGEMTFTPGSGFYIWDPPEADLYLGKLMDVS